MMPPPSVASSGTRRPLRRIVSVRAASHAMTARSDH